MCAVYPTVEVIGGVGIVFGGFSNAYAGVANSGRGAIYTSNAANVTIANGTGDGAYIVAGGAVTPAASITVTVGAGGTAGTSGAAGGSGYVWIEYLA